MDGMAIIGVYLAKVNMRWRRDWKIELIEKNNPTWADLYDQALTDHGLDPLM